MTTLPPNWTPNFNTVPQLTTWGSYAVDVPWRGLEQHIAYFEKELSLDLDPDFQRGHVWTEAQQVAFVEFQLRGGHSGRDILINCTNWNTLSTRGPCVLVDGKQRLTAIRKFLSNAIPAYGHTCAEYGGHMRPTHHAVRWHVNDLPTKAAVLKWYLEINAGGTPHTAEELGRVAKMLEEESE